MAINATNSSCMQTIYDFHNRGVGYLGNSDSCISKMLTIDPDDCIAIRVARLALIVFTGIVHVLGRLFGWCSGDAATYQSEVITLNSSAPSPRSTVEGTANATNQAGSVVLDSSAPEPLEQTFDGEEPLTRSLSGESTLNSDERLPTLSSAEAQSRETLDTGEPDSAGTLQNPSASLGDSDDGSELNVSNSSGETPPSPSGSQSSVVIKPEGQAQTSETPSPTGSLNAAFPEGEHTFVPMTPTDQFVKDNSDKRPFPPLILADVTISGGDEVTIKHGDGPQFQAPVAPVDSESTTPPEQAATTKPITLSLEGEDTTKTGKTAATSERIPGTKPPAKASWFQKGVSWLLDTPPAEHAEKLKPAAPRTPYHRGNRHVK